jgi:hypothetical protein
MSEQLQTATPAATPPPPPAPPAEVADSGQNQAEQAPAEAPADKAATDAQPEKHGTSRFERRISKLYRKLGEADARAAALQKELETFKAPKAPQEGAPKLEQFDDIEKYAEAKAEFAKKQVLKDYEAKQRTTAQQAQQKQLVSAWEEKVTAAESKYDDFEEVVGEIQPTHPLTVAIMREENGADVAYYLAKNQKEALRLAGMQPIDQILAIGKLAAKLTLEPPVAKQPSKAPPPIAPVSGKAAAPSDEISDDDDMKTFIKKRERQLGRRK